MPISHIILLRKYGIFFWENLKDSSPLERDSKNWQVNTPQSCPFSCCGVVCAVTNQSSSPVCKEQWEKKYTHLGPSFANLWNRKAFSSCSCVRHWYKTVGAFDHELSNWKPIQDWNSNREDLFLCHTHTVIRLNSLFLEVNCCSCPMCILMIHRDQNDILVKNVDLAHVNTVNKFESKYRPFLSTLLVYLAHNLLSSILTKRMNWSNAHPRTLLSSTSFHFSESPDSLYFLPNELGSSHHRNWSPHHLTNDPATNEQYPDRILALWQAWKWHQFGKGEQILSHRPRVEDTKAR